MKTRKVNSSVVLLALFVFFVYVFFLTTRRYLSRQIEIKIQTESETAIETSEPLKLEGLHQNDARLIQCIRDEKILPRFANDELQLKTNAAEGDDPYSQHGQAKFVDYILKQRRNGWFVEAGAFDGEQLSNTLFLETQRNWTGVLVEANPNSCASIAAKKRHAYRLNACLSPVEYVTTLDFSFAKAFGGITSYMFGTFEQRMLKRKTGSEIIQCFPFFAVMQAMGVYHIDYFSLDTEGSEIDILRTIPFDKIQIDVLSVEMHHTNKTVENGRLLEVRKLMHAHKYTEIRWDTLDIWFVR